MKTIDTYIKQIIQNGKGNALVIGPTEVMITAFNENDAISICDVLSKENHKGGKKSIVRKKSKTFNFKKMRKTFQKKKKDIVIGDILALERYMKTFIRDSIYITKGTIYLFIEDSNYDFDLLIKRYKRFGVNSTLVSVQDGTILVIPIGTTKNHYWKEKIYYFIDTIVDIIDAIGDILVN